MTASEKQEPNAKASDTLLELILRKYSHASRDSIRGPVATKSDFQNFTRSTTSKSLLELSSSLRKCDSEGDLFVKGNGSRDRDNSSKLRETNLDGHLLGCFSVGGEKRVCFTELVRVVLKDIVNVHEIFTRRDELLIYCAQCTPQQLACLKLAGVLPWTSSSSNLITKSDAYRLCGVLYGTRAPQADPNKPVDSPSCFEVFHECFGGCVGTFEPGDYVEPSSACIRCSECGRQFSAKKFVSHNHTAFDEVHTCHWGFDSSRWRSYLMLVEQSPQAELVRLWEAVRQKFDGQRSKKQACHSPDPKHDAEFVAYVKSPERPKTTLSPIENLRNDRCSVSGETNNANCTAAAAIAHQTKDRQSAFHPWSPSPLAGAGAKDKSHVEASRFLFPAAASPDTHGPLLSSKGSSASSSSSSVSSGSHCPATVLALGPASGSSNNKARPTAAAFQPRNLGVVHAQFTHCHGPLSGASPLYHSCQQCKTASTSTCTGLQLLAQKASERPATHCHDGGAEAKPLDGGVCTSGCDVCHRGQCQDPIQARVEDVIRRYMSTDPHQPNIRELSHILSNELQRLSLSQEEKLREMAIGNQRLQTELHLVKLEYQRKLSDTLDSKRRVEQELELVQREHQKAIARYNRITRELHREVANQSGKVETHGSDPSATIDSLRHEIEVLKSEIKQPARDNHSPYYPKFRPWQSNPKRSPLSVDDERTKSVIIDSKPVIGVSGDAQEPTSLSVHSWNGSRYPVAMATRETGSKSVAAVHLNGSLSKKIKHSSSDTDVRSVRSADDAEDNSDVEIED